MTAVQLTENLFVIVGGSFPYCNALVFLDNEITIVDPGCPLQKLRSFLQVRDLHFRDIDLVILSHIHPDHITHAVKLQELSGCNIAANEITGPLFDEKEKMKQQAYNLRKSPLAYSVRIISIVKKA